MYHLGQRHLLKPIHLMWRLYPGNRAFTKLGRLTMCRLQYLIQINLFHTSLQGTNLLLGDLIKKPFLREKECHLTQKHNV